MYKHIIISLLSLAFVGMPLAQTAPAATQPANLVKVESQVVATPRGATATLDEMIQAKLDSMNHVAPAVGPRNPDSLAKVQADSVRKLVRRVSTCSALATTRATSTTGASILCSKSA